MQAQNFEAEQVREDGPAGIERAYYSIVQDIDELERQVEELTKRLGMVLIPERDEKSDKPGPTISMRTGSSLADNILGQSSRIDGVIVRLSRLYDRVDL